MNFVNLGIRHGAPNVGASPLQAASPKTANLLNSGLPTTFGKTLHDLQAAPGPNQTANTVGAQRQNLVGGVSNSRAALPKSSPGSMPLSGASPDASAPSSPDPASTGLIQQIIASERATAGSAVSPKLGQNTTSKTPLTPAAPPTLYTITQTPSTDPGVYSTNNYSKELNYSLNEAQANDENVRRYQNYLNAFQNWQLNGSQGDPPQAPLYEAVDRNGFEQWWSALQQNMSAPSESMFLINAPNYGNGYYGAQGSGQIGTLYNPTGPATADQVQAASNASKTSGGSSTVHS